MTDQEIRLKFGEMNAGEMRLARALVAWHEREIANLKAALPERPQAQPGPWPGQQEAIDQAFEEVRAAHLVTPKTGDDYAPARLAIAQAYDKARPQSAEIAKLKSHIDHLEERDRQGREELVRLRAELHEARKSEDHWHSEAELLRAEEAKTQADLAALRQSILADDGRSLGQVAFDAGNAVQKIKFPEQEIETWEENAEVHDMLEAAAQAEQEPPQPWTPAVGDTVRLKSGGPVMTVTSDNAGGHHTCTWFNSEDARITGRFPAACLTPAQP